MAGLIDPYNGRLDLDLGIIKMGDRYRFAGRSGTSPESGASCSELGFIIERKTASEISRLANLIAGVPGERAREELLRLLNSSRSGQVF